MKTLIYTYQIILLLATLTGIIRFPRLCPPVRVLVGLLIVTTISEKMATLLAYHGANTIVYHFLVIISFWCYSLIYYLLITAPRLRFRILVAPVIYTAIALIISLTYQKLNEMPSINLVIYSVSLTVYAILYYRHLMDLDLFAPSIRDPIFLFNTAVLAYNTLSTFIWGPMDYLNKKKVITLDPLIYFGLISSSLYYFTLGMSILLYNKNKTPSKN